ncbi:MAG TPA: TIGR04282 family arsenosugar biosynthesis glycosyltransferase [Thermoanaerobaculia bacterium]|jgi:rSAM/selenodomain-associated transferase 1|nr:TIGR04282 family arsenosugar biosynthesis glycosyltransferase [Thermoanaerobaculia bacterium]
MSGIPPRRLLLFTKTARAGKVKTRLIGDLTPADAARLHVAFLEDVLARLREGDFELRIAWALDPEEDVPAGPVPGVRQRGSDLGERLYRALSEAAASGAVAAVGSDHPTIPLELVHRAFAAVESGTDVVLGPAEDGGYYLIALRAGAVLPRLFADIAWSTEQVLPSTLERCRELGLTVELLPMASDVDTPDDLRRLAERMAVSDLGCPRTRGLLLDLGFFSRSEIQNPQTAAHRETSP